MDDIEIKFNHLARKFVEETCMMSMPMAHHPAMREIVNIGLPALPYILREIKIGDSGTDWLAAIREITGKPGPPIAENERGRVVILKRKYLEWAIAEGYEVADGKSPTRYWLEEKFPASEME